MRTCEKGGKERRAEGKARGWMAGWMGDGVIGVSLV